MLGLNLLSLTFTIKQLYEPSSLNTTFFKGFLMAKQDFFIFLSRFSCKVNSKLQIRQQLKGQCQINLTSFDEKTKKIIKKILPPQIIDSF